MSDEKKCNHSETVIKVTKSGVQRVCAGCGKVLGDLAEGVIIEKVVPTIPDVEK